MELSCSPPRLPTSIPGRAWCWISRTSCTRTDRCPPLYARVLDVDNARETIRNNEILGIIQPHASKKASLIFAGLSATNPFAGYAIKGISTVYGLSIRREILFPSGTDLQIQIVRPSMLKQKEAWPGFPQLTLDSDLSLIVNNAPCARPRPTRHRQI